MPSRSGIPTLQWPEEGSEQRSTAAAEQLLHALEHTYKADFVILAGFMKVNNQCTGGSMRLCAAGQPPQATLHVRFAVPSCFIAWLRGGAHA